MNKQLLFPLLVWFAALLALGLAGFWFFRVGAAPWPTAALVIAVMFYAGTMVASCYVSVRRQNGRQNSQKGSA
jgi:hypothetical protein